tara:strand:- start:64 stop:627 length:564 start_codon:yes stop_codon:yes gene_type:complete
MTPYKDEQYFSWSNAFSPESIKEINQFIEADVETASVINDYPDYKKISTVKHIRFKKIKHLIKPFVAGALAVAERDFGYNVYYPHDDWTINYNIYNSESKDSYDWHDDKSGRPTFDIKLTLLINLSEESYDGGEFELAMGREATPISQFSNSGSAIMFKSHILHRVKPVTSGVRKSLSLFILGPKFR